MTTIAGFINRPGTQLRATIREGWQARFLGNTLHLAHPLYEPYQVAIDKIPTDEALPPVSHFEKED